MDDIIKNKVLNWILDKIGKGETYLNIEECVEDIGLNPDNIKDIEKVDLIFQWNKNKTNEYFLNVYEVNN